MQYLPRSKRKINLIVVHCAATKPSMDIGVREIRSWHEDKGWDDVGYQAVIRRDGTFETGRSVDVPGAHAFGFNANSIGICLVGGIDNAGKPDPNFTPAQLDTLSNVLDECERHYPGAPIKGHRDLGAGKACPSFDVREWRKSGKVVA